MASVSAQSAYATDIIAVQRFFYNQTAEDGWNYGYQIMLVVSTQMIGFCLGKWLLDNTIRLILNFSMQAVSTERCWSGRLP
jgi:hypothetical protein